MNVFTLAAPTNSKDVEPRAFADIKLPGEGLVGDNILVDRKDVYLVVGRLHHVAKGIGSSMLVVQKVGVMLEDGRVVPEAPKPALLVPGVNAPPVAGGLARKLS